MGQVTFSRSNRDGTDRTILTDISFTALRGEITTIVGPSEGGKSSLVRLINRLNDPTTGNILLDGKNIRELDPLVLRRQVAMVQQKPFMFVGTVLANLQHPFQFREAILPDAVRTEVRQASSTAVRNAFRAALLPTVNTMAAMGIVSLPGMMTGQILSGTEPVIAVRYQIAIMCAITGAVAFTTYLILIQGYRRYFTTAHQLLERQD
jgi:ABC-type iron transport system FetAB permease component